MDIFDRILNEAYFGKSIGLIEIEDCLDKFLKEVKKDYTKDYNNHPLNIKLQKLFCKQFGFKSCYILWESTNKGQCNLSTYFSADIIFKNNKDFLTDKQDGYYDKSHKHVCIINASTTLPAQLKLTTSEYLAIILHEIGHNFDASVYGAISYIYNYITDLLFFVWLTNKRVLKNDEKDKFAKNKIKELETINKKYDMKKSNKIHKFSIKLEKVLAPITLITVVPVYILISPLSHLFLVNTRKGEEFADSFATAYGYGSELISGLNKIMDNGLSTKSKGYKLNHFDKFLTDLALAKRYIIQFAAGPCHGTNDTRLATSISMLKKDIKNHNYPPELQKELYREVNKLENMYKLYNSPIYNKDEKLHITSSVRKTIRIIFGKRSDFIAKLFPNNLAENDISNINKYT